MCILDLRYGDALHGVDGQHGLEEVTRPISDIAGYGVDTTYIHASIHTFIGGAVS